MASELSRRSFVKKCLLAGGAAALVGSLEEKALLEARAAEETPVLVSFWFDTEDYLLPASDDAAMGLARIFESQGVRATFKVVGEKARVLRDRGRTDVIAALGRHDIGYHTDFHSVHPTPSEYSRDLGWDEGVEEFLRREGPGLRDVTEIFGRNSACYGQPGSSWTPQSYGALREWKIPLYLDDTSQLGLEGKPFWYGGILNALNLEGYTTRSGLDSDEEVAEGCRRFDEVHARVLREGGGLVSIYYHPCEWVHEQFWDGVNFARGANPPRSEWRKPPQKPAEVTERWFRNFARYLEHVRTMPRVKLVTASEITASYPDRAYERPFRQGEILDVARALAKEISYVRLGDRSVSAAEAAFLLAKALTTFGERGALPEEIKLEFSFGPSGAAENFVKDLKLPWARWIEACVDLLGAREKPGRIPSVAWAGGKPVDPLDLAATLAEMVTEVGRIGKAPAEVRLSRGNWTVRRHIADDSPGLWGWVIFPEGFRAPRMMELAKLQSWTLKPAVLAAK
jgi:hypothetical protein